MIIYAPLRAFGPKTKKRNFLSVREKVGGEKRVCGGVWECGKPERFSIISMPRSEGEKGR